MTAYSAMSCPSSSAQNFRSIGIIGLSSPEIPRVLERLLLRRPLILHSSQKIATRRTAIRNSKNFWIIIALRLTSGGMTANTPYTQTNFRTSRWISRSGFVTGFIVSDRRPTLGKPRCKGNCARANEISQSEEAFFGVTREGA